MEDGSVPPDPWSSEPELWDPPPLRYPKGLERIRRPEDYGTSRPRRKPRPPKKNRRQSKALQEEAAKSEEWPILKLLEAFVRDPVMEPYYRGICLPGEGECDHLDLMRQCINAADRSRGDSSSQSDTNTKRCQPYVLPHTLLKKVTSCSIALLLMHDLPLPREPSQTQRRRSCLELHSQAV